jgi:predicted permease
MNFLVLQSLIPVILLIAIGFIASRASWLRAESVKDLSTVMFLVLTPALMFRTMSRVHLAQLNLMPIAAYFTAALLLFGLVVWQGRGTRQAAARAISASFGNTVAIGIPLVGLAFGEAALVTLFTIVAVHALILLTLTTVVFELAVAREDARAGSGEGRHIAANILLAAKNGVLNPATTPTLLGLLFATTGLDLPGPLDNTLKLLSNAMGPVALLLVGAALQGSRVGTQIKGALQLTVLKNLALPLMVAASGWAYGLRGLMLTVMVVTASMPIGANAFMFAQRYNVAQDLVTAGVAVSTVLGLLTVSVVMALATGFIS